MAGFKDFTKAIAYLSDHAYNPNKDLKMHHRAIGAIADGIEKATLGKLGMLGGIASAAVRSGGTNPSGSAAGNSNSMNYTALKSDNVIAVMNSNTRQIIRSLGILNQIVGFQSTKINGGIVSLNNTMTEIRDSSEETQLRLSEIRDILDKQSYHAGGGTTSNMASSHADGAPGGTGVGAGAAAVAAEGFMDRVLQTAEGTILGDVAEKYAGKVVSLLGGVMPALSKVAAPIAAAAIFAEFLREGVNNAKTFDIAKMPIVPQSAFRYNPLTGGIEQNSGKKSEPWNGSSTFGATKPAQKGFSYGQADPSLNGQTSESKLIDEGRRVSKEALDSNSMWNRDRQGGSPKDSTAGSSVSPGLSPQSSSETNRDRTSGSTDPATPALTPGEINRNYNRDREGGGPTDGGAAGVAGTYDKTTIDKTMEGKRGLAAHQQEAYNTLKTLGYDDKSAKAVVANMSGENLANPNAKPRWDVSHFAHGIVQWDDERTAAIKAKFGKEPQQMTVAEQVKAFDWEVKNSKRFRETAAALKNSKLTPEQKIATLVSNYENPRDHATATSQRIQKLHDMKINELPEPTPVDSGEPKGSGLKAPQDIKSEQMVNDFNSKINNASLKKDTQSGSHVLPINDPQITSGKELNRKSTETSIGQTHKSAPVVNNIVQNHKQEHKSGSGDHTRHNKPLPAFDDTFLKMLANSPMNG